MDTMIKLIQYRDYINVTKGMLIVEKGRIGRIQDELWKAANPEDAAKRESHEWKRVNSSTRR